MPYPMPNSSGDSSGVPQRRQITDEQSPQVRGSVTSAAHLGQYSGSGLTGGCGLVAMSGKCSISSSVLRL
jgi:hypothetical protein